MAQFTLNMLGGFELHTIGGELVVISSKKAKVLLAYLAIAGGKAISREKIAAMLWPLGQDEHARTNLRQTLYVLRKVMSDTDGALISTDSSELCVSPELLTTDIHTFEACIASGGESQLQQAIELYQGPFLDGVDVHTEVCEDWLREQRRRLLGLAGRAIKDLLQICKQLEDCDRAITLAERLLQIEPLSEDAHRTLMLLYQKTHRWNEALQQYHSCEAILSKELGVEPEEKTKALYRDILDGRGEEERNVARSDGGRTETGDATSVQLPSENGKPSIAVLPFTNLSGDEEQSYFSDGITEDIITALSRFPELFVIARNSSFAYKEQPDSVSNIRQDLNVDYVVEGSVRKVGNRVRATAQLVETECGKHVWADRFDEELEDIFELQDELTRGIVAVLPGRVANFEARKIARKPPDDMAAYELLLAAKIHHHLFTKPDNHKALGLVERAIAIDPDYAAAYAWKACLLGQAVGRGFLPDPKSLVQQAIEAVNKAIALDENEVECHRILAEMGMETDRLDMAERHNERALSLNPNDPRLVAQKGELLTWLGIPEQGVNWIKSAMRLDPFTSPTWAHLLGRSLMMTGEYSQAVDAYLKCSFPRFSHHADLAGCYGKLAKPDEATQQIRQVFKLNPDFTLAGYIESLAYKHDHDKTQHRVLLEAAPWPA